MRHAVSWRKHVHRSLAAIVSVAVVLSACAGPKLPLNPPRLVTADDTDMAIQLFMQSTLLLAHYYHFQTMEYSQIQARAARTGLSTLPFMPPETVRATPELVGLINSANTAPENLDALAAYVVNTYGYKPLVKYYIRTGLRASQLICRNYLLRLEENNRYLEFLRKEFGVAYSLATGVLLAADANGTLTNAFAISRTFVDGSVTTYEEYRFLDVDREAARVLVETAQNKFAEFYFQQVDAADKDSTDAKGGYTFSDAINAVSVIEYQCTREGLHALLTSSINNTPTNMIVDKTTGTINFESAKNARDVAKNPLGTKNRAARSILDEQGGGGGGNSTGSNSGGHQSHSGGQNANQGAKLTQSDIATLQSADTKIKMDIETLDGAVATISGSAIAASTVNQAADQIGMQIDSISVSIGDASAINRAAASQYSAIVAQVKQHGTAISTMQKLAMGPAADAATVKQAAQQIVREVGQIKGLVVKALALDQTAETGQTSSK
jgi:hypothetical protein